MEDRKISDIQRINLIRKIASSEGLFGILEAVENELNVEIPGLDYKLSEGEKINQINYKKPSDSKDIIEAPIKEQIVEPAINPSITANPKEASIYREEAKALVEQDRLDHSVVEHQETISVAHPAVPPMDKAYEEEPLEENPKVLERVKNNPWSGIETVLPGQLKL